MLGIMSSPQGLWTQDCDHLNLLGSEGEISVLQVILGNYPRLGKKGLKVARNELAENGWNEWSHRISNLHLENKKAIGKEIVSITETTHDEEVSRNSYWKGIFKLLSRDYAQAVIAFDSSENKVPLSRICRLNEYRLIANYLNKYGDTPPLFPHFNGGFFFYCQDSLRWGKNTYDTESYQRMVESIIDLILLSKEHPVYFELLGDLLSQNTDLVISNWLGCSAYLRAMHLVPNHQAKFENKALYALEHPMVVHRRFDMYQFTQFKKHFQADLDAVQKVEIAYLDKEPDSFSEVKELLSETYSTSVNGFRYIHSRDTGMVAKVIHKAISQNDEKKDTPLRFAGEAELDKAVKRDTTFNAYAIVVILSVVSALIFIGLKVRSNRKGMYK